MYDQLLNLDPVKINFSAGGMMVINIVLAFVMYGVALGIKPSMLREVFTLSVSHKCPTESTP